MHFFNASVTAQLAEIWAVVFTLIVAGRAGNALGRLVVRRAAPVRVRAGHAAGGVRSW